MLPLVYTSGPGAVLNGSRHNISAMSMDQLRADSFRQPALVPVVYAAHAGEDVPLYAGGPQSALFHRTVDNTMIAQAMKYALCVEPYQYELHCLATRLTQSVSMLLAMVAFLFEHLT